MLNVQDFFCILHIDYVRSKKSEAGKAGNKRKGMTEKEDI